MTTPALSREAAALVRAIRRVHGADRTEAWATVGVVTFTVRDIHAFAAALVAEGVTVDESRSEAA